jgi:hypothetical protein
LIFEAPADNIYADTINYRKVGVIANLSTSVLIGKRIRRVECTMKKFGVGTIGGMIYCRIRSANGTIVEQLTYEGNAGYDSANLTNSDATVPFTIATPQRTFELRDVLYLEYPDGGDPGNYVRIKMTLTDKADGASSALATDDGAKTITNVDKDPSFKIYI